MVDKYGRKRYEGMRGFSSPRIPLNFTDWRQIRVVVPGIARGHIAWWSGLHVACPRPRNKEERPNLRGSFHLDEMRYHPNRGAPRATLAASLMGAHIRTLDPTFKVGVDVRNFSENEAKLNVRLKIMDRNERQVANQHYTIVATPGQSKEEVCVLKAASLESFLPPLQVSGDVISPDFEELERRIEQRVVLGNGKVMFDCGANVLERWFTSGHEAPVSANHRNWLGGLISEKQRQSTGIQTSTTLSRAEVKPAADGKGPSGPYAMAIDFKGEAVVYTRHDRYLPGNAYAAGFWVHGDGSGARLSAVVMDHSSGRGYYNGDWKRYERGELPIATLDFKGWRYIEVPLPGNGLGSNSPDGSTHGIDYPLDLAAIRVDGGGKTSGRVMIGDILVSTQIPQTRAIQAFLGYTDATNNYARPGKMWVGIHNGWTAGSRDVQATWSLRDVKGDEIATGAFSVTVPTCRLKSKQIDLAPFDAKIRAADGPFTFVLNCHDALNASVQTKRKLMLAAPNSEMTLADYEEDRQYFASTAVASSTEQAHEGKRSLKVELPEKKRAVIHLDRAIGGKPTRLSAWIHGDGSGALVYVLQGGVPGVTRFGVLEFHLLCRAVGSPLHNAVRVDWKGWRQVTFDLPPMVSIAEGNLESKAFLPDDPIGLHVGVATETAKALLYIDDVRVLTHLPPEERVSISLLDGSASGVSANGAVQLLVENFDLNRERKAETKTSVSDWNGRRIAGDNAKLQLKPRERRHLAVSGNLPKGAYRAGAELILDGKTVTKRKRHLVVGAIQKVLGEGAALTDTSALRKALDQRFERVEEDWDWVEHFKGNPQLESYRAKIGRATEKGLQPWGLLGFCAYWAGGSGLEQAEAGAFARRKRFAGGAVNIFMPPKHLEDWDNYVSEVLRGVGGDVRGWLVWNGPDTKGPLNVPATQFAKMLESADRWRKTYRPETRIYIGGMRPATAARYLLALDKVGALRCIDGIEVRVDVSGLSFEDAFLVQKLLKLHGILTRSATARKQIIISDMNWAVNGSEDGLTAFDQAAYLSRALLLLGQHGIEPILRLTGVSGRSSTGLIERARRSAPPRKLVSRGYRIKPAWWAAARTLDLLKKLKSKGAVALEDVVPDRTRALLFEAEGGKAVAIVWRNNETGHISFEKSAIQIERAEDLLGGTVAPAKGWYPIGHVPVVFHLKAGPAAGMEGVRLAALKDVDQINPPLQPLAVAEPGKSNAHYRAEGGRAFERSVDTLKKQALKLKGLLFEKGQSETLTLKPPAGRDILLRKRFVLEKGGHRMEISLNRKPLGVWDLRASDKGLSEGLREAVYLIPQEALKGLGTAEVHIKYVDAGNAVAWVASATRERSMPLSVLGPLHAEQSVPLAVRWARNAVGRELKVDTQTFSNGLGVWARSLVEYPVNGHFSKFTGKVGIDAVTGGRGSVQFEIYLDGRRVWESGRMSGLDKAKAFAVDCKNAKRLRLVVQDGGDSNKRDAANWCEPVLTR